MNKLYTIEEVADVLRVSKKTIYRHIKSGRLKAVKVGRFWRVQESDLQSFLDAQMVGEK